MDGKIVNLKSKIEIYRAMTGGANFGDCPVRDVIKGINGKWSPLLAMALAEKPYRFGELRRLDPGAQVGPRRRGAHTGAAGARP